MVRKEETGSWTHSQCPCERMTMSIESGEMPAEVKSVPLTACTLTPATHLLWQGRPRRLPALETVSVLVSRAKVKRLASTLVSNVSIPSTLSLLYHSLQSFLTPKSNRTFLPVSRCCSKKQNEGSRMTSGSGNGTEGEEREVHVEVRRISCEVLRTWTEQVAVPDGSGCIVTAIFALFVLRAAEREEEATKGTNGNHQNKEPTHDEDPALSAPARQFEMR